MKTIYSLSTITSTYIGEWEVITETELSFIGRLNDFEICFAKEKQNKKWFFSKEEAEAQVKKNIEIKEKIEALKLELEAV